MSDTEFTPEFTGENQRTDSESSEISSYDSEVEAEIYESTRISEETAAKGAETGRQRTGNSGRGRQRPATSGKYRSSRDGQGQGCMELQHIGIRLPEIVSSGEKRFNAASSSGSSRDCRRSGN